MFVSNPKFVSPTDNLMTPCSQKLSAAKKKHFTKCAALTIPISVDTRRGKPIAMKFDPVDESMAAPQDGGVAPFEGAQEANRDADAPADEAPREATPAVPVADVVMMEEF